MNLRILFVIPLTDFVKAFFGVTRPRPTRRRSPGSKIPSYASSNHRAMFGPYSKVGGGWLGVVWSPMGQ